MCPAKSKMRSVNSLASPKVNTTSEADEEVVKRNILEVCNLLENSVQKIASNHSLTTPNVKSILTHLIKSPDVQLFMKKVIQQIETAGSVDLQSFGMSFIPKVTRAKAKELAQMGETMWPLANVPNHPSIAEQSVDDLQEILTKELEDDEDDEEYRPKTVDTESSDEDFTETSYAEAGCSKAMDESVDVFGFTDFSAVSTAVPQKSVAIANPVLKSGTKDRIAKRTRSKQSLAPVSLDQLGSTLEILQPDFSSDLYNWNFDFEKDENWIQFLSELSKEDVITADDDEDENDTDFNYLEDEDQFSEDELSHNKTTRVSKKELLCLLNDLFSDSADPVSSELNDSVELPGTSFSSSVNAVQCRSNSRTSTLKNRFVNEYIEPTPTPAPPESETVSAEQPQKVAVEGIRIKRKVKCCFVDRSGEREKRKCLKNSCRTTTESQKSADDCPVATNTDNSTSSNDNSVEHFSLPVMCIQFPALKVDNLSGSDCLIIENQCPALSEYEKLQLAEQLRKVHLLCIVEDEYRDETAQANAMLGELETLCSMSVLGISSMYNIWNLSEALQVTRKDVCPISGRKFVRPKGGTKMFRGLHYKWLRRHVAEQIAHSKAFLYPDLLPECGPANKSDVKPRDTFSEAEDNLLALGYAQFAALADRVHCAELIVEHCLPHKSTKVIVNRIRRLCESRTGSNPIKYVRKHGYAPEFRTAVEIFDPRLVKAPIDTVRPFGPRWLCALQKQNKQTSAGTPVGSAHSTVYCGRPKLGRPVGSTASSEQGVTSTTKSRMEAFLNKMQQESESEEEIVDGRRLPDSRELKRRKLWSNMKRKRTKNVVTEQERCVVSPEKRPYAGVVCSVTGDLFHMSVSGDIHGTNTAVKVAPVAVKVNDVSLPDPPTCTDAQISVETTTSHSRAKQQHRKKGRFAKVEPAVSDPPPVFLILNQQSTLSTPEKTRNSLLNELSQSPRRFAVPVDIGELCHSSQGFSGSLIGFAVGHESSSATKQFPSTEAVKTIEDFSLSSFFQSPLKAADAGDVSNIEAADKQGCSYKPSPKHKSPLKWKVLMRLNKSRSESRAASSADCQSAIALPEKPVYNSGYGFQFDEFEAEPVTTSEASGSVPAVTQATDTAVFKVPMDTSVAPRIRKKRSTKQQREKDAAGALQKPVETSGIAEVLAQSFISDLKRALYMHRSKLTQFYELITSDESSLNRIVLISKLITVLCEEPTPWTSVRPLCEMLTLFLSPTEASHLDFLDHYLQYYEAIVAVWKLVRYLTTVRQTSTLRSISKCLKDMLANAHCWSTTEIYEKLYLLIAKDRSLWNEVRVLFPFYELAHGKQMNDGFETISVKGTTGTIAFDGYEEFHIPERREVNYQARTRGCPCSCHHNRSISSNHCDICNTKIIDDSMFAAYNGKFVPAVVRSFNGDSDYDEVQATTSAQGIMETPLFEDVSFLSPVKSTTDEHEAVNYLFSPEKASPRAQHNAELKSVRCVFDQLRTPPKSTVMNNNCSPVGPPVFNEHSQSTQDILKKAIRICFGSTNMVSPGKSLSGVAASSSHALCSSTVQDSSMFIRSAGMHMMLPEAEMQHGAETTMLSQGGLLWRCESMLESCSRPSSQLTVVFPPDLHEQGTSALAQDTNCSTDGIDYVTDFHDVVATNGGSRIATSSEPRVHFFHDVPPPPDIYAKSSKVKRKRKLPTIVRKTIVAPQPTAQKPPSLLPKLSRFSAPMQTVPSFVLSAPNTPFQHPATQQFLSPAPLQNLLALTGSINYAATPSQSTVFIAQRQPTLPASQIAFVPILVQSGTVNSSPVLCSPVKIVQQATRKRLPYEMDRMLLEGLQEGKLQQQVLSDVSAKFGVPQNEARQRMEYLLSELACDNNGN